MSAHGKVATTGKIAYPEAIVIGGGLAGSEAAWQLARRNIRVKLYEMRPLKMTPAHHTGDLAELVCSNSLRSNSLQNAVGLLKEEMRRLGSLIMECADRTRVPAGSALAVDRQAFSRLVTQRIESCRNISLIREEVKDIPGDGDVPVIVAAGPLASEAIISAISNLVGVDYLYFYDAVAPIVTLESVDFSRCFWGSRYGKGGDDYVNCPMTEEEYNAFWEALVTAKTMETRPFEKLVVFEGCMPIEEMARRGREALRFGPLKPVGLVDPRTGKRPYAVVQLRKENDPCTLLNLVGFQTRLLWGEQKRVFRMIPGLENAEFTRYGVMHRNTFINSPRVLRPTLQLKARDSIFFAGQITGVEGYVESAASGLVAGVNAARFAAGNPPVVFPQETAHGALCHYICTADPEHFQPMNINFGLMPPVGGRIKEIDKKIKISDRALLALKKIEEIVLDGVAEIL